MESKTVVGNIFEIDDKLAKAYNDSWEFVAMSIDNHNNIVVLLSRDIK